MFLISIKHMKILKKTWEIKEDSLMIRKSDKQHHHEQVSSQTLDAVRE